MEIASRAMIGSQALRGLCIAALIIGGSAAGSAAPATSGVAAGDAARPARELPETGAPAESLGAPVSREPRPSTEALSVDPSEPVEQPGDTLNVGRGLNAPTCVMIRSILVPGWGQAKNGAWWKALFYAGVGAAFYERLYFEDRMVDEFRAKAAAAEDEALAAILAGKVERHRGHRRDFIWWTGLFLALCGGDAYVDAHLRGFDVKIQVAPDYPPPAGAVSEASGSPTTWMIGLRASISLFR